MNLPELPKDLVLIKREDFDSRLTPEEFARAIRTGLLTEDDGVGYWANRTHFSRSHSAWSTRPPWAHYIIWLNK
jgi:hypothetical protein